jgi:cytoskeletal protein CcmA (bactofilin family)
MWGDKKQDTPARMPLPQQPPRENVARVTSTFGEAKTMAPLDSTYPQAASTSGSGATARLGPSLHVKGEITGNEDLSIDGSVEGLVHLEDRKLTVGASAKLTADVIAREVVVYGNVKGNLRARDRIEIKKDGSVVGDLTTARIMIEDGAYFKGSIEIDKTGDAGDSDDKSFSSRSTRATASAD